METVLKHFNQRLSQLMRTGDPLKVAEQGPKRIPLLAKTQKMAFDLKTHHVHRGAPWWSKKLIASPEVQGFITHRGLSLDITFGKESKVEAKIRHKRKAGFRARGLETFGTQLSHLTRVQAVQGRYEFDDRPM